MQEERLLALRKKAADLPPTPGVYLMKDEAGVILYVGKSRALKNRVGSYFVGSHSRKTEKMLARVYDFDTVLCHTEIEALTLENLLIKKHAPHYNIKLKDSKSYPYIKITEGDYPRLTVTRERKKDGVYFGPYTGMGDAYAALEAVSRAFSLPTCRRQFPEDTGKERPCLYAQMGRCIALCKSLPPKEEYQKTVKAAKRVLSGHIGSTVADIEKRMLEAAEGERFEEAARLRDSAEALRHLKSKQHVIFSGIPSCDALALYNEEGGSGFLSLLSVREGALSSKRDFRFSADECTDPFAVFSFLARLYEQEQIPKEILLAFPAEKADINEFSELLSTLSGKKVSVHIPQRGDRKKLCDMALANARHTYEKQKAEQARSEKTMVRLASLLSLEVVPERIEAYDISEWGKEEITASMVVFKGGRLRPSEYRLFKIKTTEGVDDCGAMREALSRRLAHLNDGSPSLGEAPDLILLDGGITQVRAVNEVLGEKGLAIPLFGMVKDDRHKTRSLTDGENDIDIASDDALYSFVYKLQEEVHRFAVKSVQNAKRKKLRHSALESIGGIGPKKAKLLLSHFGSLQRISRLGEEELAALSGITRADASAICHYFKSKKGKKGE